MSFIQLVSVIGGPGSGKSTLLEKILQYFSYSILCSEAVAEWQENGFLEEYYNNMKELAASMQTYIASTRLRDLKRTMSSTYVSQDGTPRCYSYVFTDGSILSDMAFEKAQMDQGLITKVQHAMYGKTITNMVELLPYQNATIYVYLKADPIICYERKSQRDRKEERKITLDYLASINKTLDNLVESFKTNKIGVIVIDANKPEDEVARDVIYQLQNFIKATKRPLPLYPCSVCRALIYGSEIDVCYVNSAAYHVHCYQNSLGLKNSGIVI